MKLRKTLLSFACAIMVALSFTACGDDWGRQDDPAGEQIYPSKTTVATYDFEYSEEKPEYSDMISHDESCEVTNDETLASNVLHINGKGGAKIANPFNGVKLQNGAAITFAVKIDAAVAEDGTVADVDLTRPLISFGSDEKDAAGNDISAHFYITANGQVVYNKPTQLQSLNLNENDPASVKTGILSPNEWHFVALQLSTEGYQLYIDGKKSLSGYQTSSSATSFKYKTLVDSINSLPYIYIGGDSKLTSEETNTVSIDNVTLIRNMMEEKDWNKTIGGNGGSGFIWKEQESIGNEDFSSGFFDPKTPNIQMKGNGTVHYRFTCNNNAAKNYETWVLAITNGVAFGDNGYIEYEICRGDAWSWGSLLDGEAQGVSASYNWDSWIADMKGATVDLYVTRTGKMFHVEQYVTTASGSKLPVCTFDTQKEAPTEEWGTFVTLEKSFLTFEKAETYTSVNYKDGAYTIGSDDNSSAFFDKKSEMYDLSAERSRLTIQFVNTTAGGANWENYVVAFTNTPFGEAGYLEYAVCRADAWTWGANIPTKGDNVTATYNWDTWKTDINGATVTLDFKRVGDRVDMTADVVTAQGESLPQMSFFVDGLEGKPLYVFLTNEKSYQVIKQVRTYPWFNTNFAE